MNVIITKHTMMKFIELVLATVLVFLLFRCTASITNVDHTILASGTFLGYQIILIGLLLGGLLGVPVDHRIDLFYSLCGCPLFIAVGLMYTQGAHNSNEQKCKGYLSIISGIFLFIDAVSVILSRMIDE